MSDDDFLRVGKYVMPSFPACASDLGFLFGTRHGVPEFCDVAHGLWQNGMFRHLLVSGGRTGSWPLAEADMIAARLVALGIPENVLILETAATNTGENVQFGRARVAEVMDLAEIRSVVVIGKICSTRRYLMTLQKHWPGLSMSVCPVNYFGIPAERWHEHEEFRTRVLSEFDKIPPYLAKGFLEELKNPEAPVDNLMHIHRTTCAEASTSCEPSDLSNNGSAWIQSLSARFTAP